MGTIMVGGFSLLSTVVVVEEAVGLVIVKTTARGKQSSRAQKRESGVGDSIFLSVQREKGTDFDAANLERERERVSGIWWSSWILSSNYYKSSMLNRRGR